MTAIPIEVFEHTLLEFFAPIRPYLEDPGVSEILINGPRSIIVERSGQLMPVPAAFDSDAAIEAALRNLAQYVGRRFDREHPILEGRMPDGSRVEAILPPAAAGGAHVAIRRFFKEKLTIDKLIAFGSLTQEAAGLLNALVACKQNIVVAGGTGSGKTSLLNALSSFIPDGERIVVIEDARELQLAKSHVVQLEAQPADERGRGRITIRDLFRATLRMRPDRIVVGEIRGGEAVDLVQAMTSGHGGCMSTLHATYPSDTLNRLETMALMGDVDLPLTALRAQIASAIDIIVQTSRLQDGSRCVTHITEVAGYAPDAGYQLVDLYTRRILGRDADGRVRSELVATGAAPRCQPMMEALGFAGGGS
ncbi:MAG: CpaF family protein [Deltaproteobacteria bacterium]|nr:MAG: CpaF family protein [Deltaproteobacteria bacterium]